MVKVKDDDEDDDEDDGKDDSEDDDEGRLFLRQGRNLSGGGKENPDMNLNGRLEYE